MLKFSLRKLTLIYIVSLISITAYADQAKPAEEKSYFDVKELNSPYVSWGVDPENNASINLLSAWKKYTKKKDVVVGVVDTGVDPTHVFLAKNIFVETGSVATTNFGADYSRFRKDNKTPLDVEGHGSHISGIIKSVYPDVKLLAIKYYDAKASGEESLSATVAALKYAVDSNVDFINYSGGGPGPSSQEYAVLKEAERKGILVIVAAGNKSANIDDKTKAFYPASYGLKNVITVTAYDETLKLLNSSNYGITGVDIAAPGYRIKSALQNGRTGYLTGTSQATAFGNVLPMEDWMLMQLLL
jgi:subtilisin family serine protease